MSCNSYESLTLGIGASRRNRPSGVEIVNRCCCQRRLHRLCYHQPYCKPIEQAHQLGYLDDDPALLCEGRKRHVRMTTARPVSLAAPTVLALLALPMPPPYMSRSCPDRPARGSVLRVTSGRSESKA